MIRGEESLLNKDECLLDDNDEDLFNGVTPKTLLN